VVAHDSDSRAAHVRTELGVFFVSATIARGAGFVPLRVGFANSGCLVFVDESAEQVVAV